MVVNPQSQSALFVGLVTLDLIYLAESAPQNNQKIVASDYTVAAGGPATNAAVTFSHLGNQATVLGVVGSHPITQLIRQDLATYKVAIADLEPSTNAAVPVSSIIVTQSTGERAVVSINAVKIQASSSSIPSEILHNVDIVLIDGHQMAVGIAIAQIAKAKNIPIAIDGGSWKTGFEQLLPFVDYAICSANFYPPNCHTPAEVFAYLSSFEIAHIAITHGEQPIEYLSCGNYGVVDVPRIQAVDTLGAGDIFHGAFCHYILQNSFTDALALAACVAANACQFFGTRRWMDSPKQC
ncbi:MAG: sugar kinase [Mojavia pulchra JT2-VF2]|jgi:sugar/nucleoside kinase (ribokinase family)|uniref:Sugar kinase n=1 Tax=Mojavia pulchra JT2-VF2 TaxID=287848 RepID=A0A951PVM2_9NOST|nr:sugar kinase [Mojavia pulchra JT2-VF2]